MIKRRASALESILTPRVFALTAAICSLLIAGAAVSGTKLRSHVRRPALIAMVTTSGQQLDSFFTDLRVNPSSLKLRALEATSDRKGFLAKTITGIQHFLGLATIVYAQDGFCAGCEELEAPPYDCGCGALWTTISTPDITHNGRDLYPACPDCANVTGALICSDTPDCPPGT